LNLKGKKAFCFIALKHHGRFLFPVTRALAERGMEVIHPTATAESPFEITFIEEGMPYRHTLSYLDARVAGDIEAAYRRIRSTWKERILEGSILHGFTMCIQDKALRMHIENFYLLRRMFEVERPDLVLVLHEMNSWGKILGYLCHEFGVPYVSFQEGLYYGESGIYRFNTEYSTGCFLWGESTREVLLGAGGTDDKMFIVGNTHLPEAIAAHKRTALMQKTRKELGVGRDGRLVTLFMGGLGYGDKFRLPDSLVSWIKASPQLTLAVKWHPFNNKKDIETMSAPLGGIPNVHSLQQYDTYRLMAASDVCVVFGNSTTGLESLAFERPLVEVSLPRQEFSYARQGVAEPAATLDDVPTVVEKVLRGDVPADRRARVDAYLRHNLCSQDGQSVQRTLNNIFRLLEARNAQRSRPAAPNRPAAVSNHEAVFDCSIVIPVTKTDQAMDALVGIAKHTSANVSYECLLSASLNEEDMESLSAIAAGDIRVVASLEVGIARLCNRAARQARGKYLCILRPGVVPQPGWLEAMLEAMNGDDRIGVVGARIVYPNALLAHAGIAFDGNFTPTRLYKLLPGNFPGACKPRKMRALADCLLVRRDCWESIGGMDEALEAYLYDVDLCLQAGASGWEVFYQPQSVLASMSEADEKSDADRLWFYGKWTGHLWPDEERYWQEDGLTQEKLLQIYRQVISRETNISSGDAAAADLS
jgi:GT2 family glycosyltransferase